MLFTAGDQLPVTPFVELVGRVIVPPEHIGAIVLNVGIVDGLTFTVVVTVVAQAPAVGVKV